MKDKIVPRKLESHILKFLERKEIIGIRGPRQAGKTTLLKSIMNKIEGDKVLIDMYFSDLREEFERRPLEFIKRFKKDGRLYLFLDEIQKCENAGESLKVIYDNFPDIKIFISGSSSLEIKTNILPHLVGRIFLYELLTFDFYEFILYKDDSLAKILQEKQNSFRNFLEGKDELEEPSFISEFNRYLNEYLIFGGYPEVVKASTQEEKIQILRNIYITWLEKDIVNFFNILETSSFENLVRYLSSKLGNIISISSISSDLRISYKKVLRYIEALKNSYIIGILKPFYKNLVTEIKKAFKIYFLDLGLRNSVLNNFLNFENRSDSEKGFLLENFIYRELIANYNDYKINYWRTTGKAEIDFILSKNERIVPIEVKLSGNISRGFYSFLESYNPENAIVITLDKFERRKYKNTEIFFVPAFYV